MFDLNNRIKMRVKLKTNLIIGIKVETNIYYVSNKEIWLKIYTRNINKRNIVFEGIPLV